MSVEPGQAMGARAGPVSSGQATAALPAGREEAVERTGGPGPFGGEGGPGVAVGPWSALAVVWMAGVMVGDAVGGWEWSEETALSLACGLALWVLLAWGRTKRRGRAAGVAWSAAPSVAAGAIAGVLAAAMCLSAGWTIVRTQRVSEHHIARYAGEASQLVRVRGVVRSGVRVAAGQRGAMAGFAYDDPATYFELRVERLVVGDRWERSGGVLLVKLKQAESRLSVGMPIEAAGWLDGVDGPWNPGEEDRSKRLRAGGIDGWLTLPDRGNWKAWESGEGGDAGGSAWVGVLMDRVAAAREAVSGEALASLRLGLALPSGDGPGGGEEGDPWPRRRRAFLEAILLGRYSPELEGLDDAFRQTGLVHILSISGAHLGVLVVLVWVCSRLAGLRPRRSALMVLSVLLLFMLSVPPRVAVVRAGLMAGVGCLAYVSGRRMRGLDVVGLAAVAALAWRPTDLMDPGFQLSYGVTASLLAFTRPVGRRLWGTLAPAAWVERERLAMTQDPGLEPPAWGAGGRAGWGLLERGARVMADVVAANVSAFVVALPMVAYHFGMVNPLGVWWSLASGLPIVALLWAGYLKIAIGVLWPSVGMGVAWPVERIADGVMGLVEHAATWPGSGLELARAVAAGWAVGATLLGVALLLGMFAGRRRAMLAAVALCAGWLAVGQGAAGEGWSWPVRVGRGEPVSIGPLRRSGEGSTAWEVTAFAVGDGSCYLVRIGEGSGGAALLFDCGSSSDLDVARRSVLPGLRLLGVERIDALMISHADLDHLAGVPDVASALPVAEAWVTPMMRGSARSGDSKTAEFVIEWLERVGVPVNEACRGWRRTYPLSSGVSGGGGGGGSGGGSGGGGERVEVELLWPDAGFEAERDNEGSMVLSIRHVRSDGSGGRRLLLTGDAQRRGMAALLEFEGGSLRADVTDLPHHGALEPEQSARFLAAVRPRLVLQSSGGKRLDDPIQVGQWSGLLRDVPRGGRPLGFEGDRPSAGRAGSDGSAGSDGASRGDGWRDRPTRLATGRLGMVRVWAGRDGSLRTWWFRDERR